jgi:predicted NAD/FAD-dependent oxidoreductase
MSDPPTFAIVGAGLAGAKAAEALRAEGFDGNVVLLLTTGSTPRQAALDDRCGQLGRGQ